jgi:CBS domain-containing protein
MITASGQTEHGKDTVFVREVMTQRVDYVDPGVCDTEAAQRMRNAGADCMPVRHADLLVGMITDTDIASHTVADSQDPAIAAGDVMSRDVPVRFDDQDLNAAVDIMEAKHMRRLVVVDHEEHMVGTLALGDLPLNAARELSQQMWIEAFEEYQQWLK